MITAGDLQKALQSPEVINAIVKQLNITPKRSIRRGMSIKEMCYDVIGSYEGQIDVNTICTLLPEIRRISIFSALSDLYQEHQIRRVGIGIYERTETPCRPIGQSSVQV